MAIIRRSLESVTKRGRRKDLCSKSKNNNKNDGGTSKKQKAMPAKIENKYEEHLSKKTQQEREKIRY